MKKIFSITLSLLFYINFLHAQDFEFGKLSVNDIQIKRANTDSNSNAIVLNEFGTASIRIDDNYGYSYVDYKYHVRIKILNKNGFDQGNIQIPLWRYDDKDDEIVDLTAATFSPSNGIMARTELDKKQIFLENRSKYLNIKKFAMPNLKEGSIIEYSYTISKKNIFNFVTWEFQSTIPKIQSQFIAIIPAIYNFNVSIRGSLKLDSQKAEIDRECLSIQGSKIDCSKLNYLMKDIPAFTEESYMTAATNFKSAIYFELSDIQHLNGGKSNITKTWKDVEYELKNERSFGGQLKKKDTFKEILPSILKDCPDDLSKAKAVYAYIKKNIRWNRYYGKYGENAIKKSLETHSGNIGDINLALIAALGGAGLDAEALILSTRENGFINDLYPVISDFNYVIAKVNIGEKSYLLDASEPLLPFGLLPLRCMNERGRVINLTKPSYWYDIKASQKDMNRYAFTGSLSLEGKIKGHLITYSSGYSAFNKRRSISEAGSAELYAEKLAEQMPGIRILHQQISNIDSLDNPLVEDYEIEMKSQYDMKGGQVYFNPFFIDRTSKNPFNLNERTYPVDLGTLKEDRVTILLKVPDSFRLSEHPKNLAIALPQNGGKYLTDISFSDGVLNFTQLFQLNKSIYGPDEYLSLKELFSRMIQQQKTDVILKKAI